MHLISVLVATGLAATVEWVEALTVALAVAMSIGWRSTLTAAAAALLMLALLTAVSGGALQTWYELTVVRGIVGVLLLLFGVRWLAKAIARKAGLKAMHDEQAEYDEVKSELQGASRRAAWMVAFKGVLLEGLEVWLIVVTLGTQVHHVGYAAAAAGAALLLVASLGIAIHRPLKKVPENTIKYFVGAMITSFGTFWTLEALGYHWLGGDFALLGLLGFYYCGGVFGARLLRSQRRGEELAV